MSLTPVRDFAPGALGLLEALDGRHAARFTLYRRETALPARLASLPDAAWHTPTRLLRTWTLDGTGRDQLDSGLAPDLWTPAAARFRIPPATRTSPVNGTDPTLRLLPVAGWYEAHALSLVRIDEVVRAFTDGATPPAFATLPLRATRDPHHRRDLAFRPSARETPPCPETPDVNPAR